MKKILTLMLAAGMLLGAASGAKAIDFKASGEWLVGFGLGDGSLIKDVDNKKRHHEDTFNAGQRVRLQLDAVASRFLINLADQAPHLVPTDTSGYVLVDVDDAIIEVHGHTK